MSDRDFVLSVQKIEPGKADEFRERFDMSEEEREGLVEQLHEEGITIESVFIENRDDGEYLLYYIEADDFDHALETWKASESEATEAYQDLIEESLVGGVEGYHADRSELIFHIDTDVAGE